MTNKPLDLSRPVQRRDGAKARIICTDAAGNYPVIALIANPNGGEWPAAYTLNGEWLDQSKNRDFDIINVPRTIKVTQYINIYPLIPVGHGQCAPGHTVYQTRDEADRYAAHDRLACVRVEFDAEEGRFDD